MPSDNVITKTELEERVRQLLAIDTNARDVYADLAKNVEGKGLKAKFLALSREEERHIGLSRKILSLLAG